MEGIKSDELDHFGEKRQVNLWMAALCSMYINKRSAVRVAELVAHGVPRLRSSYYSGNARWFRWLVLFDGTLRSHD